MKRFVLLAALGACLASACVSANTVMLDERTAIISGRGNAYSSLAEVKQKMLLEAATTATDRGFRYFVVTDAQDRSRSGTAYFPGQSQTSTTGTATCFRSNCTGATQSTTTTSPGTMVDFVKPGEDIQVRFYREGEIDPVAQRAWDAQSILTAAKP